MTPDRASDPVEDIAVSGDPIQDIALPSDPAQDIAVPSDDVSAKLPLAGIRVLEFSHMVMGPTCGLVLADLGAEVIKLEPIEGDSTRHLLGSGAGFFPLFNRNKKSIAVNLKHEEGRAIVEKLLGSVDVVIENFKQGTLDKFSLGA
ncbi:MAG: CoA transferase, partial [Betaproteobacteria bacterium]